MNVQQIFSNNRDWVENKLAKDKDYFENLSKGQSPAFLYIGCSDSRVTAENLMGLEPGEVFVHRNIANLVPSTDMSSMGVVNYAVAHLKVDHVIVCGHYYCGGVKAAMDSTDLGVLNPWLQNIRDVYRLHQSELEGIADEDKRYRRLIELNVQEQCVNLLKNPDVQKAYRERGLKVHGWVFDIRSGKLVDLEIDAEALQQDIREVYRLES